MNAFLDDKNNYLNYLYNYLNNLFHDYKIFIFLGCVIFLKCDHKSKESNILISNITLNHEGCRYLKSHM